MRIMIINKNFTIKDDLGIYIKEMEDSAEFVLCSNEQLALDIASKSEIDIVIAYKQNLQRESINVGLGKIKSLKPRIYTLLIIKPEDYLHLDSFISEGIDDFILTPFTKEEFNVRIRKAMLKIEQLSKSDKSALDIRKPSNISEPQDLITAPQQVNTSGGTSLSSKKTLPQIVPTVLESPAQELKGVEPSQNVSIKQEGKSDKDAVNNFQKTTKLQKSLRILGQIFFVFLLAVIALLAFFLVQGRLSGGVPSVFGYQLYITRSGSMGPTFDTGSLIFIRKVEPSTITEGDIITFKSLQNSDVLTTHRVVKVNSDDTLSFTTRGDANNVDDPNPVLSTSIVGRVSGWVPYLGYILGFVQTRMGAILLVFIPGILIIIYELRNIYKVAKKSGQDKKEVEAPKVKS